MSKIRKQWISREELEDILGANYQPSNTIDAGNVGGLIQGSIPFANATGFLIEDNPNLFWDAAEANLGIGTNVFGATMTQGIQIATGLAPTANVANTFAFYSADFVAGNACPHFRTENGTVIGLNQSLFTTDSVSFTGITDIAVTATNMAAGTTGQRPAGIVGDIRYNSTLGEFEIYIAAWHNMARGGANVVFGTIGCGTITVANGASINLQEDITFTGATGVNLVKFPDNLPDAFSFMEGANPYMTFITTNGSEAVQVHKNFGVGITPLGVLHTAKVGDVNFAYFDTYQIGASYSAYNFRVSNSNVLGTPAETLDGRTLGILYFRGCDNADNFDVGAYIQAIQNGVAGTRVPTDMFFVTYTSTNPNANHLALHHDGNIGFRTNTFGANSVGVYAQLSGTPPTTSPADCFQMYSADIVADHAAMHIRNENNTIIKLYQQALIADPAGQANDLDSEARTAIDAILDILENNGLMANA